MTTPTPPPEGTPPPEEPRNATMRFGDLKKLIQDTVESLTGAPPPQREPQRRQPPEGSARERVRQSRRDMDEEVSTALAKIEADKKRRERDETLDKDINDLKERTKERPPIERSRLHRFMGWGE